MADYISREVAITKLTALEIEKRGATMADARRALANMPTADVIEVVRCKDCKYFLPPIKGVFTACNYTKGGGMLAPNLNDYCSRGERRNE